METMEFRHSKSVIYIHLGLSDANGEMSQCGKSQIIRKWEQCHSSKTINGMDDIFPSWIFMKLCS